MIPEQKRHARKFIFFRLAFTMRSFIYIPKKKKKEMRCSSLDRIFLENLEALRRAL